MTSGSWTLCETKPERVLYANLGKPCCPCVDYRVHNGGPAPVIVGGIIHLDPGEDGDISGPRITVALTKGPVLCPPGSTTIEQSAQGTYELLCCCTCGCGTASTATSTSPPPPLTVTVQVLTPNPTIGGLLAFSWRVQGASPQSTYQFTTQIQVPNLNDQQFVVTTGQEGMSLASPHTTRWPSIVFPSAALVGTLYNNFLIVTVTEPSTGATGVGNSGTFEINP